MSYRAKCQLCSSVMDYKEKDIVACKCGEVLLDGLERKVICMTNDENFLEVDDEGNVIVLSPVDISKKRKSSKKELINELNILVKQYEEMPSHAMTSPITHWDLAAALLLVKSIFESE